MSDVSTPGEGKPDADSDEETKTSDADQASEKDTTKED
jgi:hypothetical protein